LAKRIVYSADLWVCSEDHRCGMGCCMWFVGRVCRR
jgi:hypothetical protein